MTNEKYLMDAGYKKWYAWYPVKAYKLRTAEDCWVWRKEVLYWNSGFGVNFYYDEVEQISQNIPTRTSA